MTDRPMERRLLSEAVECRADAPMRIGGYAAKFMRRSQDLGGFVEEIAPAFFNKSAGDGWPGVMARYNHDDNFLLGTTAGGTLRLSVDAVGLLYEVDLPSFRADVHELVARGDVRQSSFAWHTFEDDWSLAEDGRPLRTLLSGQLVDVAPVNTPAYLDTSTGLRSLAESRGLEVDEVAALAAAGSLADLLSPPAVVIDLGSARSAPADISAPEAQVPATPPVRLQLMRRELEGKQRPR